MSRIWSTTLIGALSAIGAASFFTLNDTAVKFLSGGYPLHQVILIRSVVALAINLAIFVPMAGGWQLLRTRNIGSHLWRGVLIVTSNMTFFLALAAMPIADATAIFFVSPLVIALFSVIFLGERVGPWRWAAIALGFIRVVVMIRPGSEAFTAVALLPLLAACGYAGMLMMTRTLGFSESPVTLSFYNQLIFLVFSVAFGVVFGDGRFDMESNASVSFLLRAWVWPEASDVPFFLVAGLGTGIGGLMIAQAYRLCEAALVAPMEYTAMPMAIVLGVLVFGDWPDTVAWAGIALILGAGLLIIWRESRNSVI